MQEKDLQRAVTDLCDLMGILWWHDNTSLARRASRREGRIQVVSSP